MSITILCTGVPEHALGGKYSSAGFDAAVQAERGSDIVPYAGRKHDPAGRPVLIGEDGLARRTADQLILQPCDFVTEPLLNEIPVRSFADTDREYSAETWLRKAAAQRKHADPRQPESREQVIERADRLIAKISGTDCILITGPLFLAELLDRLRIHNYVIQRTGIMKIQPLERFVISRKDEHCGSCQHNCFLSNPGCDIGRDKARRQSQKQKNAQA